MNKALDYYLWVERYRPQTVKDILLPTGLKKFFNKLITEKEIPNLLFYAANPGSGKTTTAKAICKDLDADYLYKNASKDTGIDVLRTDIQKFATTKSMNGGTKIVILDEIDGTNSSGLQPGLRAFMEEFHNTCRFILTCNYITKIIEPIKSRCQIVDFNFTESKISEEMKPKIVKRIIGILKDQTLEYKEETINILVNKHFPDIRKILNLLQQYSKVSAIIDDSIFSYSDVDDEIYDMILERKISQARQHILSKNYNFSELYRALFDKLVPKMPKEKQGQAILSIAEYMYRDSTVLDKEINFTACMIDLISIPD